MTTTLNGNNSAALYSRMNDVPLVYLDSTISSISSPTDDLTLATTSLGDHLGHPFPSKDLRIAKSILAVDTLQISREALPATSAASPNRQKDRTLYNRLRKLHRRVRALYEEAIKKGEHVQKNHFYEWAIQVKKDLDPDGEWTSFEPSTNTAWLDMFIAKLKIPQVKIDEFNEEVLKLIKSALECGVPVTRENILAWAKQVKGQMEPADAIHIAITDGWMSMLVRKHDIVLAPAELPKEAKADDLTKEIEQRLYLMYQEAQSRGERVSRQVLGQWAGQVHRDIDPEKQVLKFSAKTSGGWVDRFMRKYNIPLERDLLLELENRTLKCYQEAVARKEAITMDKILSWSAAVILEIDPHKQMRCKGSHKWAGSFVKKHDIKLVAKPTKYPGSQPIQPRPIQLTRQMEAEIDDVVYTKYADATRKRQRVQGTQLKAWAREHIFSRFGTVDVDWNGDKWMNDFAKRHGMRLLFINQNLTKKQLSDLGLMVSVNKSGMNGEPPMVRLTATETVTKFEPDVASNMEVETSQVDEVSPMEEGTEDLIKEELKEHDYQTRPIKTPEPLLTVPAIPEQIYPLTKNSDFWTDSATLGQLCLAKSSPEKKKTENEIPSPEIEEVHMEDADIIQSDSDEELLRSRASSINLVSPSPPLSPPISPQLPTLIDLPSTPSVPDDEHHHARIAMSLAVTQSGGDHSPGHSPVHIPSPTCTALPVNTDQHPTPSVPTSSPTPSPELIVQSPLLEPSPASPKSASPAPSLEPSPPSPAPLKPTFQLAVESAPVLELILPTSPAIAATLPNITRLESFKTILNQMDIDTDSEYAIILNGDQAIDIIKMTPEMTALLHKDPLYNTQKELEDQWQ